MLIQQVAVFLVTLSLFGNTAFSQSQLKNGLFFELGGAAYFYSINYERQSPMGVTRRIGVTYFSDTFVVPLAVGKVYGRKTHHFEIAGGLDFARNTRERIARHFIAITAFVGYRYQKPEKKFFAKAGFTPIWEVYESNYYVDLTDRPLYPWAGIGLGSRF